MNQRTIGMVCGAIGCLTGVLAGLLTGDSWAYISAIWATSGFLCAASKPQ